MYKVSYIYTHLLIHMLFMGGNMRSHSQVFVVHLALMTPDSPFYPF